MTLISLVHYSQKNWDLLASTQAIKHTNKQANRGELPKANRVWRHPYLQCVQIIKIFVSIKGQKAS